MSVFAAVWHLDGAPASRAEVAAMRESMPGGSEGTVWTTGPVAMAQAAEPGSDRGVAGPHEQGLTLAGTYRLDNRRDLLRELGRRAPAQTELSDAELILRAYLRWGDDAPERLLGDFAFVIWDGARRRMFCARDQVGVAPFYYAHTGAMLACATEARALLTLAGIAPRLDEAGVAAYLVPALNDGTVTLVRQVRRLPAGTALVVDATGARTRPYWRPDPLTVLRFGSEQEYASALRETLTDAVRSRLPEGRAEGTAVSGGLDSSSVSALVRELRGPGRLTPAVSVLFADDDGGGDEREWMEAVIARGGYEWHPVRWRGDLLPDPAADIAFFSSHVIVNRDAFVGAADAGVRVLFGGEGGDQALSWGHVTARPGRTVLGERQWTAAARSLARSAARRAIGGERGRSRAPGQLSSALGMLAPALARRLDAEARSREQIERGRGASPRAQHAMRLEHSRAVGTLEADAALAARHRIALRSPFWDRRVLELCLAMPPELKEGRAQPREVLRRAMEDMLPAAVLSRGKWSARVPMLEGIRRIRREHPEIPGSEGPLSELLDRAGVQSAVAAVDVPGPTVQQLAEFLMLASLARQVGSYGLR